MNKLLNKEQQQELSYIFMWYGNWKENLHADTSNMSLDELEERERWMEWYAYMAVRDCDDLGLDAGILFSKALIGQAWEYENEVLPRQTDMTRKELESEQHASLWHSKHRE